jgi:hypothetical protein
MSLYDLLELQLQLLSQPDWHDFEVLPPNVIRLGPRRCEPVRATR